MIMNTRLSLAILAGGALVAAGAIGSRPNAAPAAAPQASGAFVIRNVMVFDGERTSGRANVVVRDGLIASVGAEVPAGIEVVDGTGQTLLPGLIDAHTHAFGNALERALQFGVTTELDMFTDHRFAAQMRAEQRQPAGASRRADLFSAGTLVTSPGGHGTEYGMPIPTIASAAEAQSFVDARLAEGSDYIKIVFDDGSSYGRSIPTITLDVLKATIDATKRRNRLAVVHIGARKAAEQAIEAGASGLVHLFADAPPAADFASRVKATGAFVIPTLSVAESISGVPSGKVLLDDERLKAFVGAAERAALGSSFPKRPNSTLNLQHALATTKLLHEAGVPVLAGTDAPNPGTAHGVSMHRELELLVRAGLNPQAALAAATSVPARVFGLKDRGRITSGLRADLLLVKGDPLGDVTALRDIVSIWKGGVLVSRARAADEVTDTKAPTTTGMVSSFEQAEVTAEFGGGWQISTDSLMGGKSAATMRIADGGANGTKRSLEISGTVAAGSPYPWAGAMFFPASTPMTPANLSSFKAIVFWARGDGGEHQLMVFATRLGNIPATYAFIAGPEWREHVVPLASLSGLDGSDIKGILFSAGAKPGPFRLSIDEVRFR
jgi:imidazolonepropionase-like amidohydrolase